MSDQEVLFSMYVEKVKPTRHGFRHKVVSSGTGNATYIYLADVYPPGTQLDVVVHDESENPWE